MCDEFCGETSEEGVWGEFLVCRVPGPSERRVGDPLHLGLVRGGGPPWGC